MNALSDNQKNSLAILLLLFGFANTLFAQTDHAA